MHVYIVSVATVKWIFKGLENRVVGDFLYLVAFPTDKRKMRKIRLSDTDIEFFDMEVSPTEFLFFTKHKDAFRCMWREQVSVKIRNTIYKSE